MKPTAVAMTALIALAGCAAPASRPTGELAAKTHRQCFWAQNVTSFQALDDRHVNIMVGVGDVYQMTMFGRCSEVDWANRIALTSHGGSMICTAMDAEVVSPTSHGPERCPVDDIRKLSAAEVAAL